jgi:hypothetical protein
VGESEGKEGGGVNGHSERAREIGRIEWAAMVDILYPPEERAGMRCTDADHDRIAIHTTYENVMKLRAEIEDITRRIDRIEGKSTEELQRFVDGGVDKISTRAIGAINVILGMLLDAALVFIAAYLATTYIGWWAALVVYVVGWIFVKVRAAMRMPLS